MFVLKRKSHESITIDGHIKITILDKSKTVRIGIEAPRHIFIVRDELIKSNNPQKSSAKKLSHENSIP